MITLEDDPYFDHFDIDFYSDTNNYYFSNISNDKE